VYPVLRRLARFGLAGRMGSGRQYVSWLHEADFLRAVDWLIARADLEGAFNLAAPNPVPNAEWMRRLREAVGATVGLPAAEWMLEVGAFFLRTETELILKSRRVLPGRLLASGFQFQYPELPDALREIESRLGRPRV
jgi:NAD dependent epimerase/dehydratase family enzyme